MNSSRDLLAELEVTMVPSLRRPPETSAQAPLGGSPDIPAAEGGSRRRHFWCSLKKQEVEVEFETRSHLGLRRMVGVRRCTAFDRPQDVACGRHCLDSKFRGQWPSALPVVDRRCALGA